MTTIRFRDDSPDVDGLYADVAAADLQPLWVQTGLMTETPDRLTPYIWRWKTMRDLAERSGDLIGIDRGGDRRVLSLAHPDLGGLPFATHTLWGAVQFLGGGELAPAHRHSPAALRFVLEGSGVWTLVNGDAMHMAPGDLVLTPSWTWHEHHNPGTQPMIWFDGLDVPLVRNLDAVFFEPGGDELTSYEPVLESRSETRYRGAGLRPADELVEVQDTASRRNSRLLAYRWPATDSALNRLIESTSRREASVRYTDPASGRDIMPTLRAELHRILSGHRTQTTRTVGSGVWVVYGGSGSSVINGQRFSWTAGDMFVTPSWAAVDHEAADDSDLFLLSDGPAIEALGLARTERVQQQDIVAEAD
jgi:gentisate 1,2-dioxygenase